MTSEETSRPATLPRGTTDLIFREGDERIVVDYKSDDTAGRLDDLLRFIRHTSGVTRATRRRSHNAR